MPEDWHHQLRLYLPEALAEAPVPPALAAILAAHDATMVSQLAAFEAYLATAAPDDPLYRWTAATLADPARRRKHAQAFALRIGGQEVYAGPVADALEAALRPLVGGVIARLSRHDTNPANNLPIPAEYRA
ncbi:hypothetical protein ACFQS7_20515 [Dankookia sp. GCM10030260]|uniref:hypothetical protein n=1 Tax=Dankookia sp. GCM10030260 TaxID=3273390 RepID=UPI003621AE30